MNFLMPKKVDATDNGGVNPDVILIQSHIDRKLNELFAVRGQPKQWAFKQPFMSSEGSFKFDTEYQQFSVQNSTGLAINIGLHNQPDATHFDIRIPVNCSFMSIPFSFTTLWWYIPSYVSGTVNPFLVAYQDARFAPGYHPYTP